MSQITPTWISGNAGNILFILHNCVVERDVAHLREGFFFQSQKV
ncbi:hypothetical protein [Pseudovibrio denitrificans]|nr:hypothetical protein [Pseudovibrio denitrificans]